MAKKAAKKSGSATRLLQRAVKSGGKRSPSEGASLPIKGLPQVGDKLYIASLRRWDMRLCAPRVERVVKVRRMSERIFHVFTADDTERPWRWIKGPKVAMPSIYHGQQTFRGASTVEIATPTHVSIAERWEAFVLALRATEPVRGQYSGTRFDQELLFGAVARIQHRMAEHPTYNDESVFTTDRKVFKSIVVPEMVDFLDGLQKPLKVLHDALERGKVSVQR